MKKNEKISVIIPVYNADETIKNTINSVQKQTYNNIELVIVENGPKKDVEKICEEMGKFSENVCIKYFYSDIANVSAARNCGIKNSTGEYITFLDSDDIYKENFLEEMVLFIKNENVQLVVCGYETANSKQKFMVKDCDNIKSIENSQEYLESLLKSELFNEPWNKMYISKIIKDNKILYREDFNLGEDLIFNLDYYKCIKRAGYLNKILYIYTDNLDGLKLKYRNDKFDIEYKLTQYLENFYKENNYDMEYVYNFYARVYYNAILNIYNKRNPANGKKKKQQLNELVKSKRYNDDLNFLKDKITDKKFKIAVKYFFLKGEFRIRLFVFLKKLYKR